MLLSLVIQLPESCRNASSTVSSWVNLSTTHHLSCCGYYWHRCSVTNGLHPLSAPHEGVPLCNRYLGLSLPHVSDCRRVFFCTPGGRARRLRCKPRDVWHFRLPLCWCPVYTRTFCIRASTNQISIRRANTPWGHAIIVITTRWDHIGLFHRAGAGATLRRHSVEATLYGAA